jgi:nucleotide-binding universal stress UspA family protein
MFRTIVAGTDTHEKGRNAVALAHELASATDARLLLVAGHQHGSPCRDILRRLRRLRNELAPGALVLAVPDASPANALRRVAEEQGADLIVVGARERSRLRRVIEREPGMQLVRAAPCAVVVAPDRAMPPQSLRRIGVCVDKTPEPAAALDLARSLAHCTGARVMKLAGVDEATPHLGLLVLASRDAGWVRRVVREQGCPVLLPPRQQSAQRIGELQLSAART